MSTTFKIAELSEKLQHLVDKTYEVLSTTDNEELKENLRIELEKLKNRADLRVAFVGQYSSGKSTIISALTGNKEIKIDANVATDQVSEYRWNNIVLMDTPGILAGKVEQHDERTKEALRNTDLIVYVLTSQLFDDVIFENFIDLAYNQHLKDKMLIAINKMSMENGDFDVLSKNYSESIKMIFKERGYDFDFEIVYIDAADYIEGTDDNDEEFVELSNFNTFISTLNQFVEKKGIIKKQFDSPVRLLKSAVSDISLSAVDPSLQTIIGQYDRQIKKSKKDIEQKVKLELSRFEQKIIEKGQELGNSAGEVSEEEFKNEESAYEIFVQESIQEVSKNIEELITNEESALFEEIDRLDKKETIINYKNNLQEKLNSGTLSANQKNSYEKQMGYINMFKKGSDFVVKNSLNTAGQSSFKTMTSMASGSNMKNIVYNTGKFFGAKFKPWGATKIASNIGKTAKIGGALLSVAGVGFEVYQTYKEEKENQKLQESKRKLLSSIRAYSSKITNGLSEDFLSYINSSYGEKIKEIDFQKNEIINAEKKNSQFSELIEKLDTEYVDFIEIVEKS